MTHPDHLFAAVVTAYRAKERQDLREIVALWQDSTIPLLTRLRTVETVAVVTWQVVQQHGVFPPLPKPDPQNFLARPIDATTVRLIVYAESTIVVDAVWPGSSTMASWHAAVDQLARRFQRFAGREDPTVPQERAVRS